eukprot:TRINITY_DN552_c0_g1_i1.p2 TRINITY_DN552_c0_g1~~TRINITY_DN552_c0_g1_i1.p2  ORF type:complete len:235 (+),score=67.12 TRINITY_DN552_c0_g1_i1:102-806(+)
MGPLAALYAYAAQAASYLPSITITQALTVAACVAAGVFLLIKVGILRTIELDVEGLHQATKKGIGKPLPEAFDIINAELERRYPGLIVPKSGRRWIIFNGGGAMGQMTVLHASLTEYLIFYGSPLYSQGHSGRYLMDVYDFMIQGETKTYHAAELTCTVFKAGEYSLLKHFNAKGYCCEKDSWMLEYGRGVIPFAVFYFLCASVFVTFDIIPWLTSVISVGKRVAYNLLVNRKI